MKIAAVTHVALRVTDVRAAETYYCALFDLTVAWREAPMPNAKGWGTLPAGKTWADAEAAGLVLSPVFLWRDGFGLALEHAATVTADGQLSHIGLLVDQAMFEALQTHAPQLGCTMQVTSARTLVFDDQFNIRWEPTTVAFDNPAQLSSGVTAGRWLTL